jgi:hypothetical protein
MRKTMRSMHLPEAPKADIVVPAMGSLLTPAAAVATVLALWRLGADLRWTGEFAISEGLFSHWQVWLALAFLLQTAASRFSRPHTR